MLLAPYIKKIFLLIVFLSCFSCFAKPDYNLPLFVFAFILWDIKPYQKTRLTYLFIFSWIIDFVWLVYWGPFWNSSVFKNHWASGIQTFVIILASFIFIFKLAVIVIIIWTEADVKKSFTPGGFVEGFRSLVTPPNPHDDRKY